MKDLPLSQGVQIDDGAFAGLVFWRAEYDQRGSRFLRIVLEREQPAARVLQIGVLHLRFLSRRFQKINDARTLRQLAQVGLRIGVLRGEPCLYLGVVAILQPAIVIDYAYAMIGICGRNFFRFGG